MRILTIITYILLLSCANQNKSVQNKIRVNGHLILAAGGSCLISNNFSKTYQIGSDDLPDSVWIFLKAQKELKDPHSLSNLSVFAAIEIEGEEYIFQENIMRIKVLKIISIKNPDADFHKEYLDLIEHGKL